MLTLPQAEEAAFPRNDDGGDLPVLGVEGQSGGVTQLAAVAEVDDLHTLQSGGCDLSHGTASFRLITKQTMREPYEISLS